MIAKPRIFTGSEADSAIEISLNNLAFQEWQVAEHNDVDDYSTHVIEPNPELERRAAAQRAEWAERSKLKDKENDALRARINAQRAARMARNIAIVARAAETQQKLLASYQERQARLTSNRQAQTPTVVTQWRGVECAEDWSKNYAEAIAAGAPHYHGRPCPACGGTLRYVVRKHCVACAAKQGRNRRVRSRTHDAERYRNDPTFRERKLATRRNSYARRKMEGVS